MSLNVFQKWLLDFLNVPFALVSLLPPVEHCHSKQSRSPHTHRGPLQGSYLCCVMLWSQSRIKPRQPPSPLLLLAYISVRERERIKKRKKKGRKCPGGQGKTTKQPKQLGARRHTPVSWKPLATKHDANSLKVTVKDSSKRRVRKKKTKKKQQGFPVSPTLEMPLSRGARRLHLFIKSLLVVSHCQMEGISR